MAAALHRLANRANRVRRGYLGNADLPLNGYTAVLGAYSGLVTAVGLLARATGRRPPERIDLQDVVLLGVATHKLSRLVAKEAVMSPLRAPFTRYREPAGLAELNEEPRGEGAQHTVGELVNCPFCLAVWVATGMAVGLVFAPRLTRLVAGTLGAVAVSDGLHIGYDAAKQHLERVSERKGTT
ncbi:MAG TPA: DUF1360 domain-containing protein [Pseudonocardiaceae bacterium]|nr:DUF1360 domain-containing protein [Pseudonocardiaceae bacterium]